MEDPSQVLVKASLELSGLPEQAGKRWVGRISGVIQGDQELDDRLGARSCRRSRSQIPEQLREFAGRSAEFCFRPGSVDGFEAGTVDRSLDDSSDPEWPPHGEHVLECLIRKERGPVT